MSYFFYFFSIAVALSQVVDVVGYKYRCNKNEKTWSSSTSIANLLFYAARLLLMFYVSVVAIYSESFNISLKNINYCSLIGVCLSIIYLLVDKKLKIFNYLVNIGLKKTKLFKIQINTSDIEYLSFKNSKKDKKLILVSFVASFFIIFCCLLPINLAYFFPNYKLSVVYFSQILGVVAGLTWYIYQDPILVNKLNSGKFDEAYVSLCCGKILSLLVIFFIMGASTIWL